MIPEQIAAIAGKLAVHFQRNVFQRKYWAQHVSDTDVQSCRTDWLYLAFGWWVVVRRHLQEADRG